MKAVIALKYGSPDVLQIREMEKPAPEDNEVLIKINETIVTPSDCAFRKAEPFITRFFAGLLKPRHILGVELAGEIEAVGKDVKLYTIGDRVFGTSGIEFGAHAEYKCLPETEVLEVTPENITDGEAAAVCDGGLTSLVFLRDKALIKEGQKILINGASGSVGSFAVQLAKYYGAEVTGVCSAANAELVTSLGADNVIDYNKKDFSTMNLTYDIIFDAVGKSSFSKCKKSLKENGKYLTTVPSLAIVFQMLWTSKAGNKKAIFAATGLSQKKENLTFLKKLLEEGKLKSVIDRRYQLEQIADAHRYVDEGHKKGNVVIKIN